jgi:hypothetical protein
MTGPSPRGRRKNPVHGSARLLTAMMLSACLAGCTPVKPWQRGILAKPQMAVDPHPVQSALRSHGYLSREAASGGGAQSGGGCGCY